MHFLRQTLLPHFFYIAVGAFFFGIALHQILLGLFFLVFMASEWKEGRLLDRPFSGQGPALFFVFSGWLSALAAAITPPGTYDGFTFHWAFLVFWVINRDLVRRLEFDTLVKIIMVCALPGLVKSIFWLLQADEIQWALQVGFTHFPRAFGFNSNPITHSEGLIVACCWVLARMTRPTSAGWRKAALFFFVLVVAVITCSRVRSGWAALVAVSCVHLLTYPPHRKGLLLFFSLFFPGVLVVIWFFGFNVASLAERSELLARGWHLFLEHPWLGIGPGQFFHYPPTPGGHLTHPHNTLLGLLAEQGILGVAAFALFFVHLIRRNWLLFQTYRAQDTPLGWVSRSLLYVNLTFIINGLTDYNLGSTVMLLWYAIHWAVLARLPLPWETQGSFEPRPR